MNTRLILDRILPAMNCRFVGCPAIWMQETKRRLSNLPTITSQCGHNIAEIRFLTLTDTSNLMNMVEPGSMVIIAVNTARVESMIPLIHDLYRKRVIVAVIGDPSMSSVGIALQAAGSVAMVTDIFGCQKLASIIHTTARLTPEVIADWRTRFVSSLPWNPVGSLK